MDSNRFSQFVETNRLSKIKQDTISQYAQSNHPNDIFIKEPQKNSNSELMIKQFQTLKQINHILDSNPQSQEAKDIKIRSLVVMFKRQLDINKKLESKIIDCQKIIQGKQQQLSIRNTQCKKYQKTLFEQKQKIVQLQSQNKKLHTIIQTDKQQIKVREDLIEKMKESYQNQKYSMENQLHYLKQKTIDHFTQKLEFPLKNQDQKQNQKNKISKSKSKSKANSASKNPSYSNRTNIIRKNILAISKKQNELLTGQNLLRKFQNEMQTNQRLREIRNGNYHSAMSAYNNRKC